MSNQKTLKREINIQGVDLVSGNPSSVILYPADTDTGIVFQSPREQIKACLDNAYALTFPCKTILLKGEQDIIAVPEHILAQLYAYGVDNAYVKIEKKPSKTAKLFRYFGSAKNTQFVPHFGSKLCEELEGNIKKQSAKRKKLSLEEEIRTDKIIIKPNTTNDLRIYTKTNYKIASKDHILQERGAVVSRYMINKASKARGYCSTFFWAPHWLTKSVACFAFLSHGFGNGNSEDNIFYPVKTREEWYKQERIPSELAYHTIMDRLGELSLLPGRLYKANLYCHKAGHKEMLEFLKEHKDKFKPIN